MNKKKLAKKTEKKNWKKKNLIDLRNKNWILTFVEKETFNLKNKIEITNKTLFFEKKVKKKYLIFFKIITKLEKKAYIYVINENKNINLKKIKQDFKNVFFIIKIKNHLYQNKFIESIKDTEIIKYLIKIINAINIYVYSKLKYIEKIIVLILLFFLYKSARKR